MTDDVFDDLRSDGLEPEKKNIYDWRSDAWLWALRHPMGRRLIYDMLDKTMIGVSAFGGSAEITTLNAGKQMIGEYVLGMLNQLAPDAYTLMLKEQQQLKEATNDRQYTDE